MADEQRKLTPGLAPRQQMGDDPSRAGAGAQQEYERRRDRRTERIRERFGAIGGLVARLTEPQHQSAWAHGAEGERRLAARLTELLEGSGVVLFHDRRLGTSRANIDHIAVGPGGITVIDAKNLSGAVETRRGGAEFWVGGRNRTDLVAGVNRQVAAVARQVADGRFDGLDVHGVLCLVDPSGLPLLTSGYVVQAVAVTGPRGAAQIACREGALTSMDVRMVCGLVDRHFPVHTA